MLPNKLYLKLQNRIDNNALRNLGAQSNLIDFSSNDYLGFASDSNIFGKVHQLLLDKNIIENGGTGSRLLSGNHPLYTEFETQICKVHHCEAALVFNSGYTANLGFFSSLPQRGDIIFYDELVHASIRDGLTMSQAKSYKFKHNDLDELTEKIKKLNTEQNQSVYVVTESVFSMDGDSPDLLRLTEICKKFKALLIIDEAHALGVFSYGLMQELNIENDCFARIITFGKAIGVHGAAILGSQLLIDYLINFSRPFIYTTSMPPHTLASLIVAYDELNLAKSKQILKQNISHFQSNIGSLNFISSNSAIQSCIISGNERVKSVANKLMNKGYDIKPILSPTVPKGYERLRFCLHSFNNKEDISQVLSELKYIIDNE